ncbi:MAG: nitrate/sulfonate/bicarbonate ABC transporter ATP-binding protein [Thermodesulfobacteriota bacterium]
MKEKTATPFAAPGRLLDLVEVVRSYGQDERRMVAVDKVTLAIDAGEFVCLLGPSGCGKSTLLRIIAGLDSATAGTVLYRGEPLTAVNPHATIVFQTFALYPWLTVLGNVEVALKAKGIPAAERRERALRLIDTVGLDGFESAYPRELSGGMRQKVGFARAMAVEPELLCLDEPFSALDVLSAEALRGELMELWQNRRIPTRAILMVTHNIEEAVLMADRIVVMGKDPGHILADVPVTLRHPRQRKDTAFQAWVDRIYGLVTGRRVASAAGHLARKKLPHAHLNALAGLVEKLLADGGRNDLYRLSGELVLELDDLLPIVEAGELVGFVAVQEGDLILTPLGKTYAEANILARKELIAARILRLPLINWIYETLQQDDDERVAWEFFLEKFESDFGDRAEKQLDIAIMWGRHAELFAYDDKAGELYLEQEGSGLTA